MHLSSYAKDKFIAPEMSEFTSANIRDMSAISSQQEHGRKSSQRNTGSQTSL